VTVRSTTDVQDIELIIENVGGGGGDGKPPANHGGGDDGGRGRPFRRFSARRYFTGIQAIRSLPEKIGRIP